MGVKIRPINRSDLRETCGEVVHVITSDKVYESSSVESPSIFGTVREKSDFIDSGIYNKRGYIHFGIPVVNFFLAGDKVEMLSKILDVNAESIAIGRTMYNKSTGKEFNSNSIDRTTKYTDDILIGGRYLQYLIDNFDVTKEIKKYLGKVVVSCLPIKNRSEVEFNDVGSISEGEGKFWIIDEYYYNPTISFEEEFFVEALDIKRPSLVDSYTSRLVLLLSIRGQKDKVRNQIMEDMIVLPIGYRPTIDRSKDRLTKQYNKVVKCNNDLKNALTYSNATIKFVEDAYRELVYEVKTTTTKNITNYDKQYKPIIDILKGKEGLIRDKMQGTRSDYTGRAVITVDPNMSIDTIGVPRSMAEKLMELEVVRNYKTKSYNKGNVLSAVNRGLRQAQAARLLEGKYAIIGRQPTLYQLGIKAFKVKIVEGNALVLNPLSTPSFNADFDGDQMHVSVPITQKAIEEVNALMASTNNLFLPRSGDCHISPRQELIYGLWKACTIEPCERSIKYTMSDTHETYNEVMEKVCTQEINIYDEICIGNKTYTAGYIAIKACLGSTYSRYRLGVLPLTTNLDVEEKPVKEKWFAELLKVIALASKPRFIEVVNKLVKLGFAIANIWPPNISVLEYPDVSYLIDEFDERVRDREELYNMGFETEDSFTSFYDKEFKDLEKKVKKEIKDSLGSGSGYMDMVDSGARGSMSNMIQLFGMKGRVKKNEDEAFNAILRHPLATQLTGLEHFVTAYGSRQGLIDKTVKTYEPGYLERKMGHTEAPMYITTEDCGTTDGLVINYDTILQFIPEHMLSDDDTYNNRLIRDYVVKLLVGRFVVGIEQEIMNDEEAKDVYSAMIASIVDGKLVKKDGVKLRSPITCKNPCCVKCYGTDLGTNTISVVGLPIGFISAQSIGEPGTQLTMKNFQSGGVAGVTNLTSSFDKMSKYLHIYDLRGKSSEPLTYDYIAPVEGFVETVSKGDGTKQLKIMNYNSNGELVNRLLPTILLYEEIKLKDYVHVGDSIQQVQGDLSIREILEYRSPREAQTYLTLMLFDIFQKEVFVNLKHFEVLVASMTFYVCTKGNDYFKVGTYYTVQEYRCHDTTGCKFFVTLKGIKEVPSYRSDLFSTIFMENIHKGITRSIVTSGYDSLTNPLVRTTFGLDLGVGSDVDGFVRMRGNM